MDNGKEFTERFLVALFRRGKAEFLPVTYLKKEGDKVLVRGETDKLLAMLEQLTAKGVLEMKNGEYKLINDPFV